MEQLLFVSGNTSGISVAKSQCFENFPSAPVLLGPPGEKPCNAWIDFLTRKSKLLYMT